MTVRKTGYGKYGTGKSPSELEEEKKAAQQKVAAEKQAASDEKLASGLKVASSLMGSQGSGGSGGESKPNTNAQTGFLQGGMSGAATGASIGGGPGAIVGGGIGAVTGILQAKQAKKEALAEIQSKEIMGVAETQSKEEEQKQSIMSRLGQAIQNSLIRR